MEKLLSVHEAAALLGLSPRTVYNLVARDQIPVQRVRRRVMFRPSALDRWLDEQAKHEYMETNSEESAPHGAFAARAD
jgi:excisionase family DNA binding protein